tara:strand:+ start:896 stop:1474 length:579 start_codon:yes stop_codon:yes gene_type:complete
MTVASQIEYPLTPEQQKMARLISREFMWAGLPPEFAAAAIVNAWHESKLNPGIQSAYVSDTGVREDSVGLFQLYIHGAGAGMVLPDGTDLRSDPNLNTRRIIQEIKHPTYGKAMFADYNAGNRSISHFAGLFARDIERCAECDGRSKRQREETALKFFPTDRVKSFYQKWWFWTLVALATGGTLWYRQQHRT